MFIGVPREIHRHEHRVGLSPFAAAWLAKRGHSVLVESKAGNSSWFSDQDYQKAGAQIVYDTDEVYQRADLVCRVNGVTPEEIQLLRKGSVICAFHHLAVSSKDYVQKLMELETTIIGYEIVRDSLGEFPILDPMSEIGGQFAVQLAASLLQNDRGGRGILLGNAPGVPPPTVLIIGGGTAGFAAARQAHVSGAHVIVLDSNPRRLREIHHEFQGQVVTALSGYERLEQYTRIADLIIGAVLVPGAKTPYVVTESMVSEMKPGSVIIDLSIDQGGCVETSRPTSLDDPTYTVNGVVHYCVSNMTANIARTASRAIAGAALPMLGEIASLGLDEALRVDLGLAAGVYMYKGKLTHRQVAEIYKLPMTPIMQMLDEDDAR
ncbi:MAG: alanine dehydrogenase [Candidatus Eisenbacteria bacterium]|uniref:alanine dehydrogenase n=1 Tax=Eiseniibacteriota bacterium TaxID=2212470 RepID=A0A956NE62_UNCEI|nr:alanine dehydrogenase [Candidatus Eisenbacteria bacterium]MCB9464362.1 alanine dehydrogenase [Candidatus Eisenbacteria bacterium]